MDIAIKIAAFLVAVLCVLFALAVRAPRPDQADYHLDAKRPG